MLIAVYILIAILLLIFIHDIFQKKHAILRNFPIVGHFRYMIEKLGPELRQYIVANDKEEMPFSRSERSWIYATSKKQKNEYDKQSHYKLGIHLQYHHLL